MKQKQFEEHFKTLELSKTKDSWGNEIYAHSHVQAIWDGWVAALTQAKCPVCLDPDTVLIHRETWDAMGKPKADVEGLKRDVKGLFLAESPWLEDELIENIIDHLAARGCFGVPEGYALVPIEPTFEQRQSGFAVLNCNRLSAILRFRNITDIYKAMIKSAQKKEGV